MLFLTMCQGNYKLNVCKQGNVFAEDAMINKQEMQLIFAMLEEIKTKICIIRDWMDFFYLLDHRFIKFGIILNSSKLRTVTFSP